MRIHATVTYGINQVDRSVDFRIINNLKGNVVAITNGLPTRLRKASDNAPWETCELVWKEFEIPELKNITIVEE